MWTRSIQSIGAALSLAVAAGASAQQPTPTPAADMMRPAMQASVPVKEARPGLLAKATVKAAAAEMTALNEAKGGKIADARIEERRAHLVYVFHMEPAAAGAAREVVVDAMTGKVVPPARTTAHRRMQY
jgi:uncharacterized membrane protein YkoI